MEKELSSSIKQFILQGVHESLFDSHPDAFWQNLRKTGTELWLDTGDLDEAARNWTSEMSALTTNNTLLNSEIQKGIYDELIATAGGLVKNLPLKQQVVEIAFILNAYHGLRLARKFGGFVSVELHTDTAHDLEAIFSYGKRYADISPGQFIVKVPYTASGLLGARRLHEKGVRINFTLEFSARQNLLATAIARPDYVNVFLGRLGAYVHDNNLGSAEGIGERTVWSAQKWVRRMSAQYGTSTRLIAASLRNASQLEALAGIDIFTMPVKIAHEGRSKGTGNFYSRNQEDFTVNLNEKGRDCHIEKLWEVNEQELMLVRDLADDPPCNGEILSDSARKACCADLFPELSEEDMAFINSDGKIPRHDRWESRIRSGELAVDTLLNLAGLASFANDQAQLDHRIESIISK